MNDRVYNQGDGDNSSTITGGLNLDGVTINQGNGYDNVTLTEEFLQGQSGAITLNGGEHTDSINFQGNIDGTFDRAEGGALRYTSADGLTTVTFKGYESIQLDGGSGHTFSELSHVNRTPQEARSVRRY